MSKISRDKKLKLGKLVITTNADKIKQEICSYDNEKLAELIENSGLNTRCKYCVYYHQSPDCMRNGCIQGVVKWLEKKIVEKK